MITTCQDARNATVLAAYGELEPSQQGALRAHLISCPECAAQARQVRAARELVATAEGHPLPESPVAHAPVVERRPVARPVPARAGSRALAWVVGVAAVLVVAVLLVVREDVSPRRAHDVAVASGPRAAEPAVPLARDTFDEQIESLQTDIAALESRVGEF